MREDSVGRLDVRSLVFWPALITLAVTLARLAGELLRWSDRLFNRTAGGAFAVVGIVWLVPVFGVYFALRLLRAGESPRSAPWSIVGGLLGLLAIPVLAVTWARLGVPPVVQVIGFCCTFPFVAWAVGRGWPALARVLLAYGLAARVPVILIMLLAILDGWGTHYSLGRPDLPPLEPPLLKWFVVGLAPQVGVWIPFTVIGGSFFGGLAALVRRSASRGLNNAAA